jgi:hypothetical protein
MTVGFNSAFTAESVLPPKIPVSIRNRMEGAYDAVENWDLVMMVQTNKWDQLFLRATV